MAPKKTITTEEILANIAPDEGRKCLYEPLNFSLSELSDVSQPSSPDSSLMSALCSSEKSSSSVEKAEKLCNIKELLKAGEESQRSRNRDYIPSKLISTIPGGIRVCLSSKGLLCLDGYTNLECAILYGNIGNGYGFTCKLREKCLAYYLAKKGFRVPFEVLLAMLAHCSACPISSILPPERTIPEAENYFNQRLCVPELSQAKEDLVDQISISRVGFLFQLISLWDFSNYGSSELALLIFAAIKISLDRLVGPQMKLTIAKALDNVLSYFTDNQQKMVAFEFSSMFQFLDNSLQGLTVVMRLLSASKTLSFSKLLCLRRTLVGRIGGACIDGKKYYASQEEHLKEIPELLYTAVSSEQSQESQLDIIYLLREALDRHTLRNLVKRKYVKRLLEKLMVLEQLFPNIGTEDAVLSTVIRLEMRIIETWIQ